MWRRFTILGLAVLLAGCGDDNGISTTTTTVAPTTTVVPTTTTTTTSEASPTTTTLGNTTLAEGVLQFTGTGAFTSEPFSLPVGRCTVETTAGRIGTGSCAMVVKIERATAFGRPEFVYFWLYFSTEGEPSTETDTKELSIVLPSKQYRLVTEPDEREGLGDCTWEVTLRPA